MVASIFEKGKVIVMNYQLFNKTVTEHRNSLILIGVIVFIFAIIGVFVVEFYVRRELDCKYFEIKNFKIAPTILMVIPIIAILVYFPVKIVQCNRDVKNLAYEEYIGEVEYSSSSVKFHDADFSVFVGKGHEIVPAGKHYGKVVFSRESRVIVYYEQLE